MVTLIVRLHEDPSGGLKGTVEEPGQAPEPFRDAAELMSLLESRTAQAGNGLGSTSSSAMRDT